MRGRVRVPLFVVALVLLGLIGLLAALQFRWLGQISDASRDRLRATLESGASAFARDFDAELTRAYLLFQVDPLVDVEDLPASFGARYDRWHAARSLTPLACANRSNLRGRTRAVSIGNSRLLHTCRSLGR